MLKYLASMTSTEQKEGNLPLVSERARKLVLSELQEIVGSRSFAQGTRLTRFLSFVVKNYLNGTTERLKESVIGVEVYDRPVDYDPKVDSIVRSEARRLRRKLHEYYEAEGQQSQVKITVPTGGYAPHFEFREQLDPERDPGSSLERPTVGQLSSHRRSRLLAGSFFALLVGILSGLFLFRQYRHRQTSSAIEHRVVDEKAYRIYLEGRFYWAKRTPDFVHKAIARFEQALRLQPDYALAYSGLADSYAITASGLPPMERSIQAKYAADRALGLDPLSAEANTSKAFVLYKFDWNWQDSEAHFRRALELNSNYALAHHWFGEFLILRGQTLEGLFELRKAESIEPLSLPIKNDIARGLYRSRFYDRAIGEAKHVLDLDPSFSNAYATLTYAFEQKHDYRRAVEADLQVLRIAKRPETKLEQLREVFEHEGWKAYWRAELRMLQDSPEQSISDYVFAEIYVRIGNYEKALHLLEKSFDEHNDAPLVIGIEPLMDPLRSNIRFQYLLRRSGLA